MSFITYYPYNEISTIKLLLTSNNFYYIVIINITSKDDEYG